MDYEESHLVVRLCVELSPACPVLVEVAEYHVRVCYMYSHVNVIVGIRFSSVKNDN